MSSSDHKSISHQPSKLSPWSIFLEILRRGCTNKYGRIVVYAIACLTTSCIYFGWQAYSELLFRNGAYEWLCSDSSEIPEEGIALCVEQDKAITRLYSFANGSEFVSAAVGGLLLDHLGPRYTALLGEGIFLLAVVLVAFSSQKFQGYIPGLILSGACVNIISFPSLVVIESWPTRQALAVSVIVGAQSGASVIAPILSKVWDKHPDLSYAGLWGCYLAIVYLPVVLLYIWALPTRRDYAVLVKSTEIDEVAEDVPATGMESRYGSEDYTLDKSKGEKEDGGLAELCSSSAIISVAAHSETDPVPATGNISRKSIEAKVDPFTIPELSSRKQIWKAFWRDVRTIDLIVMAIYFLLQMLQFAYYPSVVRDAVSLRISDYVGWMTPLQAVFSVVIGFIMDYTGTCLVMYGMGATLIFVSLSVAYGAHVLALQYVVGALFVFMQSATYNVKFTFVNEMYDPFNFGKLVGLLGIMGGIGVYINAPIASSTNYKVIFTVYAGVAAFMILCAVFLYARQRRGVTHKTLEGIKQKNRREHDAQSKIPEVEKAMNESLVMVV